MVVFLSDSREISERPNQRVALKCNLLKEYVVLCVKRWDVPPERATLNLVALCSVSKLPTSQSVKDAWSCLKSLQVVLLKSAHDSEARPDV